MKATVFWDVMQCSLADIYQTTVLSLPRNPVGGGSRSLGNGKHLSDYTALHPGKVIFIVFVILQV
jgi:hypothetical protein